MTNKNVEILNDVTKMLIDSRKGYEKAAEVSEDNFVFQTEFQQRAGNRANLVNDFQGRVRHLGGEAETDGGALGKLHRMMTDFSAMFRDDVKAALDAIDDGEEQLADTIEDKLKEDDLDVDTRVLLQRAHASAKEGERFADRMDD